VLEDWRWKYNHIRPHRSLGYITPQKFAQQEPAILPPVLTSQCRGSVRPTASLRPGIDFLYNLSYNTNLLGLTNRVAQFG
ncbi:MAG: integrase core domain-containing protein, partial [Verrucomicrobiota bacterium]